MSSAVRELFGPIDSQMYDSREQAEHAVAERFAALRRQFDPDYGLYQLLAWSYQHGWIQQAGDKWLISVGVAQ